MGIHYKLSQEHAEVAKIVYLRVIAAAKEADLDSDGTVTREEIDTRIANSLGEYIKEGKIGVGGISPEAALASLRMDVAKLCTAVTALRMIAIGDKDGLRDIPRDDLEMMVETLDRFPEVKELAKTLPIMDADKLARG